MRSEEQNNKKKKKTVKKRKKSPKNSKVNKNKKKTRSSSTLKKRKKKSPSTTPSPAMLSVNTTSTTTSPINSQQSEIDNTKLSTAISSELSMTSTPVSPFSIDGRSEEDHHSLVNTTQTDDVEENNRPTNYISSEPDMHLEENDLKEEKVEEIEMDDQETHEDEKEENDEREESVNENEEEQINVEGNEENEEEEKIDLDDISEEQPIQGEDTIEHPYKNALEDKPKTGDEGTSTDDSNKDSFKTPNTPEEEEEYDQHTINLNQFISDTPFTSTPKPEQTPNVPPSTTKLLDSLPDFIDDSPPPNRGHNVKKLDISDFDIYDIKNSSSGAESARSTSSNNSTSSESFKNYEDMVNRRFCPYAFRLSPPFEGILKRCKFTYSDKFKRIWGKIFPGVSTKNPIRRFLIWFTTRRLFTWFILLCIIINCSLLAIYDPVADFKNLPSIRNDILTYAEYAFSAIFFIEMILKIAALGVIGDKRCYFRDPWNVLDFIIVITSLFIILPLLGITELTDSFNFSTLRAFRVLRPLRAVTSISEIRVIVNALLRSIPLLLNAFVLFLFFLILFSIVGVQMFQRMLRQRCHHELTDEILSVPMSCAMDSQLTFFAQQCPDGYICVIGDNDFWDGFIHFDHFFASLLAIFQSVTMEGWVQIMYRVSEAAGAPFALFFIVFMIIGAMFIVNLVLVILNEKFHHHSELEKKRIMRRKRKKQYSIFNRIQQHVNEKYGIITDYLISRPIISSIHRFKVKYLYPIVVHPLFGHFITILIFLNTITLAVEHYGQPDLMSQILKIFNYIFTALFTLEMVIKFFILGPKEYLRDIFNVFDVLIVFSSLLEIIVLDIIFALVLGTTISGGISVLRTFRLLRVVRLAKSLKPLQRLINAVGKSLKSAFMLTFLLLLIIFIYALLGMQFFGGKMYHDEEQRFHFDDLFSAMLTVFQVVTGENWNLILYETSKLSLFSIIYLITLLVLGNYIIINLFIAVLIQHVNSESERTELHQTLTQKLKSKVKSMVKKRSSLSGTSKPPSEVSSDLDYRYESKLNRNMSYMTSVNSSTPSYLNMINFHSNQSMLNMKRNKNASSLELNDKQDDNLSTCSYESDTTSSTYYSTMSSISDDELEEKKKIKLSEIKSVHDVWAIIKIPFNNNRSMFLLKETNLFRRIIATIVTHRIFEYLLILLIIISSIALGLENPFTPPDAILSKIVFWANIVFTVLFTIESILKIIAFGFWMHPTSYIRRSGWNKLDFIIVVFSIFNLATQTRTVSQIFRGFRMLRTLKPLRFINKSEGLRVVVDALFASVPAIFNVALISMLIYLIFGIMGVQLFKGKLYHCSDLSYTTKEACQLAGLSWINAEQNFDNIFMAILTLFEIATMERWNIIMWTAMDHQGIDVGPRYNASPLSALFFVIFIVIGSFFVSNLFVGVLIDKYQSIKESKDSINILLTPKQREWYNMQKNLRTNISEYKPEKPKNKFRAFLYSICVHVVFELVIVGLTLINVGFMALNHYGQPKEFSLALDIISYVFTFIFTVEIVLKLFAFGFRPYFRDRWNQFDFLIQVASLLGIAIKIAVGPIFATSMFRTLRVARLFKVVKQARPLRILMSTLFLSFPSLINVSALLLLMFFIYSIMGMKLFGLLDNGEFINHQANFRSLWTSMLTLFRMTTGEDWNGIMHDCMRLPPECSNKLGTCATPLFFIPSPIITVVYFTSFMLLGMFVLQNLFIAVLLDNFSNIIKQEESGLTNKDIRRFVEVWARYDPTNSQCIPATQLAIFLVDIGSPLGVNPNEENAYEKVFQKLSTLDVYSVNGRVHYHETVLALAKHAFGVELPPRLEKKIIREFSAMKSTMVEGNLTKVPMSELYNQNRINRLISMNMIPMGIKNPKKYELDGKHLASTMGLMLLSLTKIHDIQPAPLPSESLQRPSTREDSRIQKMLKAQMSNMQSVVIDPIDTEHFPSRRSSIDSNDEEGSTTTSIPTMKSLDDISVSVPTPAGGFMKSPEMRYMTTSNPSTPSLLKEVDEEVVSTPPPIQPPQLLNTEKLSQTNISDHTPVSPFRSPLYKKNHTELSPSSSESSLLSEIVVPNPEQHIVSSPLLSKIPSHDDLKSVDDQDSEPTFKESMVLPSPFGQDEEELFTESDLPIKEEHILESSETEESD